MTALEGTKRNVNGISSVFLMGVVGPRVSEGLRQLNVTTTYTAGRSVEKTETIVNLTLTEEEEERTFHISEGDCIAVSGSFASNPAGQKEVTCVRPENVEKIDTKKPKGINIFSANVITTMKAEVFDQGQFNPLVNIPAVINELGDSVWVALAFSVNKDHQKKLAMLKNLKPGTALAVKGRIKTSAGKDGKQYLKLMVKKFVFPKMTEPGAAAAFDRTGPEKRRGPLPPRVEHSPDTADYEDDLPF